MFGPRYARPDTVTFGKDTVQKRVDNDLVKIEVRVTQAACELARMSSLFHVPRIVEYDLKTGTIVFERIAGYITIGQLLARPGDHHNIIWRIGRVLAHINGRLQLPANLRLPVASQWLRSDSAVVVMHGDFNTINVGYKEDSDTIVVLDWASAPILGPRSTIGPMHLDIAHFIYSLLMHQANFVQAIRHSHRRIELFLDGYQTELGREIDRSILADFLLHISASRHPERIGRKGLLGLFYYGGLATLSHVFFYNLARGWRKNHCPYCPKKQKSLVEIRSDQRNARQFLPPTR
ncbi:MAG: hypothetical protein GY845_31435 [Planctomycetes bacterium]|nr:hypothetical protein [Planctomycetota bacterium]